MYSLKARHFLVPAALLALGASPLFVMSCSMDAVPDANATREKVASAVAGSSTRHEDGAQGGFSYAAYTELLKIYVDDEGYVDYKGLLRNRSKLHGFLDDMASISKREYDSWGDKEKMALWINAYNAITLKYILNNYPIKKGSFLSALRFPANSIRQISGVWDTLQSTVVGRAVTLGEIEHEILRKEFDEARLHVSIVCASGGCPPLRNEAYEASKLEEQLRDQSRKFLADSAKFRIERSRKEVHLTPIFDWFGQDFVSAYGTDTGFKGHGSKARAVLNFISQNVSENDARYLSGSSYTIKYQDYDWSLNER